MTTANTSELPSAVNVIVSNFKHVVNIKTIRGIRAITNLKGHKPILGPNFTIEDIHKLREYNYYQTKKYDFAGED